VQNSDSQVPFTIKVIDSDDINAFALPGGFLACVRGLAGRNNRVNHQCGFAAFLRMVPCYASQ
jgi:predicted Zn-dependent protease